MENTKHVTPSYAASIKDEKSSNETVEQAVVANMFTNAASATGRHLFPFPICCQFADFIPEKEHQMTLLQGIRLYPKAIFWAALIAMCCAMEGYDIALIGNFYAFPPFNRKYGQLQDDGTYEVPAQWQAGISNGAQCGQIIGLLRMWYPLSLSQIRN